MKAATTILRLAALAVLALASLSCRGKSSGPTAPRALYGLRIITAVQTQKTAPAILDAKLFLDGNLVADWASPRGTNIAEFGTMAGPVRSGSHTFSIRIVAQTVTPNLYTIPEAFVDVLDPTNPSSIKASIEFITVMKTLATGQSIDLRFSVP